MTAIKVDTSEIESWFDPDFKWLRPHWGIPIEYDGTVYRNVVRAYLAAQTDQRSTKQQIQSMADFTCTDWLKMGLPPNERINDWNDEVAEQVLTLLCADKYGLIRTATSYRDKLLLGYNLALTNQRSLRYKNSVCDLKLGYCVCHLHLDLRDLHNGDGLDLLGTITTKIRASWHERLRDSTPYNSDECDYCFFHGKGHTQANHFILYTVEGNKKIRIDRYCPKHGTEACADARKIADDGQIFIYDYKNMRPLEHTGWSAPVGGFSEAPYGSGKNKPKVVPAVVTPPAYSYTPKDKQRWGSATLDLRDRWRVNGDDALIADTDTTKGAEVFTDESEEYMEMWNRALGGV